MKNETAKDLIAHLHACVRVMSGDTIAVNLTGKEAVQFGRFLQECADVINKASKEIEDDSRGDVPNIQPVQETNDE